MNLTFNQKYIYLKMALKAMTRSPSIKTLSYLVKYFSSWKKYLQESNSVIDKQPWLSFPAIDFIKRILKPEMRVFEYGSGGSTLFWAGRAAEVISIEHDQQWFLMMKQELEQHAVKNVSYFFIPPSVNGHFNGKNPGNPADYISADERYRNQDFKQYASSIDQYGSESFDIILIDGRARPSCISHALDKLKKNGFLIIDNSERSYYLEQFNFEESQWKTCRFFGPVPYTYSFSETTIIKKR